MLQERRSKLNFFPQHNYAPKSGDTIFTQVIYSIEWRHLFPHIRANSWFCFAWQQQRNDDHYLLYPFHWDHSNDVDDDNDDGGGAAHFGWMRIASINSIKIPWNLYTRRKQMSAHAKDKLNVYTSRLSDTPRDVYVRYAPGDGRTRTTSF